jgi:hypothetical protein
MATLRFTVMSGAVVLGAAVATARAAGAAAPPPPPGARLAFQEDWSAERIDASKWYPLRKRWGQGNNGVTPDNVAIDRDTVNGTPQHVLVCEAHGDDYDGPVVGAHGDRKRVGGVIATHQFFAAGRFEVIMKVGGPQGAGSMPRGAVPAIWTYAYRWVGSAAGKPSAFDGSHPQYNPLLKVPGSPATELWSEIDFPELGKNGDFGHGGYNVFCQNRHEWNTFEVPPIGDGQYHTYTTEWRTGLKPVPNVRDSQVVEWDGFWWVQDATVPIGSYLGNPLRRLSKDRYAACCGLSARHWIDGRPVGQNASNVPCMAAQLTLGVWLPAWGGPAPWRTARVSFGPVRVWQYDDPGDVRGVLTEDVPPNF